MLAHDIQQGLKNLLTELPILEERYRRLLDHFRAAGVAGIEAFVTGDLRTPDAQIAAIAGQLDAFGKQNVDAIPFALTLVAERLKTFRQLARLATRAAPSMNAADIAATPYALAVSMVLDRLEDKGTELRAALKNNRILVAKDLLTDIYDTEYALQAQICRLDESQWGMRLNKIMNAIAADVDAEVSKFPEEVGHVLESLNQRRRQSIADRLTHMASKGRDAFNNGVASCMKLIGQA